MFAKAGITTPPTTTAQLISDAQALNTAESSVSHFSPIYVAGKYWYGIFSWIFDAGGGIAQQVNGKWQGQFSTPADQTALTWVHSLFTQGLDKAPGDADETNDDKVFEAGKAAMIIEPGWDYGVVKGDFTKANNAAAANDLGVFVIPGQVGRRRCSSVARTSVWLRRARTSSSPPSTSSWCPTMTTRRRWQPSAA